MVFGKRIDEPGGSRRSIREDLTLRSVIMTTTESFLVDLMNLSKSGARLGGGHLPAPGQEVMALIGRLEAFATVVWRDSGQCGIHFDVALSETALDALQCECRMAARLGGSEGEDWIYGVAR